MLSPGDTAPDFSLEDHQGNTVTLDALLAGGRLVLMFYPQDFSPGCTAEACMVRDRHAELAAAGYTVATVNSTPRAVKSRFASAFRLPYVMLSDPGKKVAKRYDADGWLGLITDRVTYVINPDKTIADAVTATFNIGKHKELIEGLIATDDQSDS